MKPRYYVKAVPVMSGPDIYYVMDSTTNHPCHWGGYVLKADADELALRKELAA